MSRAGTTRQSEPEFHRVGSIVLLGSSRLSRVCMLSRIPADFTESSTAFTESNAPLL